MRLLILGGTLYLGRHTVEAARARGHEVTLFNRGQTNPELYPDVERIRGDRERDLSALRGRTWDGVIDTCGYVPRVVRASAELLADAVELYVFVSSISAYADATKPELTEADTLAHLPDGAEEVFVAEHYGALKARCEATISGIMPGRVATIRAGLIQGPHDQTDRSSYWPSRVARGGEVLAPGKPERPVQLVDARDLADWMVRLCEERVAGVFNATGPDRVLTMGEYLETCRAVAPGDARFTWVGEEFLLEQEVAPYNELPIWVPASYHAFQDIDCRRAFAAGLAVRPLAETLRDILAWDRARAGQPRPEKRFGVPISPSLDPARERDLLSLWHARGAEAPGRSA